MPSLFFFSSATDCRPWPDTSEFWTYIPWAERSASSPSGIRFRLRPRRCSTLYSPLWTFSIVTCSYTSNVSRANWTMSTSDAINAVAVFRLTVGAWRLMLVLLRWPRISCQAVAIIAVSSSSILRENPSAWFLVSAFCSLSAVSSSRTSWMLSHPSTSALTAAARSHHRVPVKPFSVSVHLSFSSCQRYVFVDPDRNTYYSPLIKSKKTDTISTAFNSLVCATKKTEKNFSSTPWAYFTNGPNAAASIAPTLIRHWVKDYNVE